MSVMRWINRERVLNRIRTLPRPIKEQVRSAIAQSADEITDAMRRAVPEHTKRLRRSIIWQEGALKKGGTFGGIEGDFVATIHIAPEARFYAHLVEFGTAPHEQGGKFKGAHHPGTPPQPYFYPTVRAYKRRVRARIKRAVKKAIEQGR